MGSDNAYDPDKLTNEEYKEIFGKPSPLERKLDGDSGKSKPKKKKKRKKKRNPDELVEEFFSMSEDKQREIINALKDEQEE